ncbi:hypothetical protein CJF31_00008342 [Rutstroemia sp. NJR-2017a BVV2]|nr:hypothetical protein CJF31_00008342 [Rutstroemia sp. NJR-2017a BVV2]
MVKWIALRVFEVCLLQYMCDIAMLTTQPDMGSRTSSYKPIRNPNPLLASPTFHRAVRSVHKKVHEAQHGKVHSEMGGLRRDEPTQNSLFLKHLKEELRDQFWGRPRSGK